MQRQEIGSDPVSYTIDERGVATQAEDGQWVRKEDAKEILDWLRVFVHTVEGGSTFASLRSIAAIARKRVNGITK